MAVSPLSGSNPSSPPAPAEAVAKKRRKDAPAFLALAVIALCLILLAAIGIFVVYPQINGARHWRQAQEAIDRYDLTHAREHLEKCLAIWPSSGETEFLMARTCRRAGDLDAARDHLQTAKRLNWVPQQIQLESHLIHAQIRLEPWVEEKLRGFLQDGHPEERYILEALVMGCLQGNLFKRALEWTTVWVEHHPDDWEAHYWNGSALEAGLAFEKAAKEFEKAIALNSENPGLHFHLAQAYWLNGRAGDALLHFQEYVQSRPDNPAALLGLARCHQAEGLPEEARQTLRKLFDLHPDDAGGLLLEAKLALEEDNFPAAKEWLEKALQSDPYDREANQDMARVLRHEATALENENRKQEAERKKQLAERYEKRDQEIAAATNRIAEIVRELMQRPANAALLTEAGATLMSMGRNDEAFRWLIGAWMLDPNHQPAKEALAKCLRRLGDRKLEELYQPLLNERASFQDRLP
jgi:tetratricopeptide (TPR) repeat protein